MAACSLDFWDCSPTLIVMGAVDTGQNSAGTADIIRYTENCVSVRNVSLSLLIYYRCISRDVNINVAILIYLASIVMLL